MKHPTSMRMGQAKRNRGTGTIDWAHLAKLFPDYREQIHRLRFNPKALYWLKKRLVNKFGLKREKMVLDG